MGLEKRKESIVHILTKLMETNIELMTFYKHIASDDKSRKVCAKSIRQSKKAIEILPQIEHTDILVSLYNTLISGKENIFVMGASIISSKKTQYFDKTKKGYKEFLMLEEEAQKKNNEEREKTLKEQEFIKKAKEQGKKIEYIMDKDTGKMKPVIVEETA